MNSFNLTHAITQREMVKVLLVFRIEFYFMLLLLLVMSDDYNGRFHVWIHSVGCSLEYEFFEIFIQSVKCNKKK